MANNFGTNKTTEEKLASLNPGVEALTQATQEFVESTRRSTVPLSSYDPTGDFDIPADERITASEIQQAKNL